MYGTACTTTTVISVTRGTRSSSTYLRSMPQKGDKRTNDETMRIDTEDIMQIGASSSRSMTTSSGNSTDDSSSTCSDRTTPSPSSLPIDSCVYRGEGNASVVIALPHEYKVIRFRKSLPGEVPPDGGKVRVQREVEFVRDVISGFFGSYAQIPEIVRYDTDDITRLSEAIRSLRPEKRRWKDITEVYATKFPDYAFLPTGEGRESFLFRNKSTFCVEIKPKQGYLRKVERRYQKCPYCLTQYYKLKKGAISSRSSFCPFDLFSGVRERMKIALIGLLESPQNNFKIFKNGTVVYDQESTPSDLERVLSEWFRSPTVTHTRETYIDIFCSLITNALLHPFDKDDLKSSVEDDFRTLVDSGENNRLYIDSDVLTKAKKLLYFTQQECNFDDEDLPRNSVLERILRMQRLPYGNTETIRQIYSKYSAVVNDDVMYSNFKKVREIYNEIVHDVSNKKMDTRTSKKEIPKEMHLFLRAFSMVDVTNDDNSNGNRSGETTCSTWSTTLNRFNAKDKDIVELKEDRSSWTCAKDQTEKYEFKEENTKVLKTIESILALQNYLLFCTARDCSILIAFRELDVKNGKCVPQRGVIESSEGQYFLTNIGVSDLDPKSVRSIEKHEQRDTDVLNAVISILEEELTSKNLSICSIEH